MDQLLGMMSSMSMYRSLVEKYPENTIMRKIKEDYEVCSDKCDVEEFTFPGFVIIGINEERD